MSHLERCTALCAASFQAIGSFVCLGGRLFGDSGCQQAPESINVWHGLLVAASMRVSLSSVAQLSSERLVEALRRALAAPLLLASNRIIRLSVSSLVPLQGGDGNYYPVRAAYKVEFDFEVAMFDDGISPDDVSTGIMKLAHVSNPQFILFSNVLRGNYDVTAGSAEILFKPFAYTGHAFTVSSGVVGYVTSEPAKPPDHTALVAGIVLSVIVLPLAAALIHWINLERKMKQEIAAGHTSFDGVESADTISVAPMTPSPVPSSVQNPFYTSSLQRAQAPPADFAPMLLPPSPLASPSPGMEVRAETEPYSAGPSRPRRAKKGKPALPAAPASDMEESSKPSKSRRANGLPPPPA